ncbi:serine--tRNA ligase [Roseococcus sp. SDR]|uniref:serine--tRNA ligase n=1 Tax=Roseococcus sp. SDR TaxID=2835532 RepID=UPI001BCC5295|nr:serine--tRNA ligase [Roseococcus sp. SDR]MBS7792502.1 serine--tRNA ligase [Roseococcus sp. SDR]MBV1847816.1 serine--tRNA ligase [Roseococcus sp. SDR]
MHDIRAVRADAAAFDAAMARRGLAPQSATLIALDEARREAIRGTEAAQSRRNELSREIGAAMKRGDKDEAERLKAEVAAIQAAAASDLPGQRERELTAALEVLPNILDAEVPEGRDETANVVLHTHGTPAELPDAKQHFELGEALGLMDFTAATRLSGSRFVVLKGQLARLERALGQWMLGLHVDTHGYMEVAPPLLVNATTLYGTNQLPKFEEDLFKTGDHYLIPTAEVPLTNLVADQVIAEPVEPLRYTALTPCFRSEAGSAGRDTRGMLRQHQFSKVEMVSITRPEDSDAEHERMTRCAEAVLTALGLTWRRVFLCAGDTGFGAARTYDLEVWLPGQKAWREISSCSNCRDFQARRMKARFKRGKEMVLPHTLNGSGVAVGRALIAVMETHQQPDGTILVPEVLRPWMGVAVVGCGA